MTDSPMTRSRVFMNDVDDLIESWRAEADGDHVAPWHIAKELRRRLPDASADEIRAAALRVARGLLQDPTMEISSFDRFDPRYGGPWQGSRDDILRRLDEEWRSLGRDPGPGEIGYIHGPPTTI
jgi:hypothetical protein